MSVTARTIYCPLCQMGASRTRLCIPTVKNNGAVYEIWECPRCGVTLAVRHDDPDGLFHLICDSMEEIEVCREKGIPVLRAEECTKGEPIKAE